MTGPEYTFEVQPQVLAAYAETLHARAADLAAAGAALAAVPVERDWFGKLPAAGFLAGRYAAHRDEELAEAGTLAAWVAQAARGLVESAGRYSGADRVVAGVVEAVAAGLGVGIAVDRGGDGAEAEWGDGGAAGGAGGGEGWTEGGAGGDAAAGASIGDTDSGSEVSG